MELGAKATFKGKDGKPKTFTVSDKHIDALMSHAGNRAIPSHWSHDWFGKETDAIHDRVGMLKTFRRDDSGSLIADLHLSPGQYRDKALWSAENEPGNIMLSAVYGYSQFDADCIPSSFEACDLVAQGAATYSLLSKANPEENDMTKEEIIALIKEQSVSKDDLTAALANFKPAVPEGVLTEDKLTAALANFKPAAISDDEKKSIALLAKAEFTKDIGATGALALGHQKAGDEFEAAITAQLSAGAKDRPTAILRLAQDKPAIYNAAVAAGKA